MAFAAPASPETETGMTRKKAPEKGAKLGYFNVSWFSTRILSNAFAIKNAALSAIRTAFSLRYFLGSKLCAGPTRF